MDEQNFFCRNCHQVGPMHHIALIEIDDDDTLSIWINDFHYMLDIDQYPAIARLRAVEKAGEALFQACSKLDAEAMDQLEAEINAMSAALHAE